MRRIPIFWRKGRDNYLLVLFNWMNLRYLNEIERLEKDVAENVAFGMRNAWRSNATTHIQDIVRFEVRFLDYFY
jgi:hypothetical protein